MVMAGGVDIIASPRVFVIPDSRMARCRFCQTFITYLVVGGGHAWRWKVSGWQYVVPYAEQMRSEGCRVGRCRSWRSIERAVRALSS